MKRFRNFTVAAIGLAILVLATALSNTSPAGAQSVKVDSVKVVNTAGDWAAPVPVQSQGTTNIAGNVGINGTPNVNVVNMPSVGIDPSSNTVQVGNTTANPVLVRDVDNPAFQPFQRYGVGSCGDGSLICDVSFGVPPGKLLVIEHVSASASLPPGQMLTRVRIRAEDHPDALPGIHTLVTSEQAQLPLSSEFTVSQSIRLYAGPKTDVHVTASRADPTGLWSFDAGISGYLVNLP